MPDLTQTLVFDLIVALLIVVGALFSLLGSFGLLRMDDFFSRLHTPTKATTLGVGSLLLASAIYFSQHSGGLSLHEILVAVFLLITAPVGAHLMAKSALHLRLRGRSGLPPEELLQPPKAPKPTGDATAAEPTPGRH
jgi:multicomponent K+:H+ antiporter subunit G